MVTVVPDLGYRGTYVLSLGHCFSWHNRHNINMRSPIATAMTNKPVEEAEIRAALLACLRAEISMGAKVHEEFRIERGGSRIDVAVIGPRLVGYEIKSDADSFVRFANQIHAYNRVFDEIYLACGPSHVCQAEETIPSWWGILVAERTHEGTIELNAIRRANGNPRQDPFSLASLLWKNEALAVLTAEEEGVSSKVSSHMVWESIASTLPVDRIKTAVVESLLKRQDYRL
jgi:hypothetical protein